MLCCAVRGYTYCTVRAIVRCSVVHVLNCTNCSARTIMYYSIVCCGAVYCTTLH